MSQNIQLCGEDSNVTVVEFPSVAITSVNFYMKRERKVRDINLRKAVLYAIDQDEVILVMESDMLFKAD
ncbi:MAG TPA: hypothetical protein DHV55_06400 [Clostridiaceae bacterium]|nr:hypothetical protein [Clostridiaceae bacterium]